MDESCRDAKQVLAIDAAFKRGNLDELKQALGDKWRLPNGPMPLAIGSPLEYALYHSPPSFVRTLLDLGADPRPEAHDGFPPLIAVMWQNERADVDETVRLLLEYGADPDQRGMNDYTALHVAVLTGRAELVEILLAAGADPNARTRIDELETPADLALKVGRPDLADLQRKAAQESDSRC